MDGEEALLSSLRVFLETLPSGKEDDMEWREGREGKRRRMRKGRTDDGEGKEEIVIKIEGT